MAGAGRTARESHPLAVHSFLSWQAFARLNALPDFACAVWHPGRNTVSIAPEVAVARTICRL
jgi:hypothetical protein